MRVRDAFCAYDPPGRLLGPAGAWMTTARAILDAHRADPSDPDGVIQRLGIEDVSRGVKRSAGFVVDCYAIMTEVPEHPRLARADEVIARWGVAAFPRRLADAFHVGLQRMQASSDPTHDLAHLTRVAEVARLLSEGERGDWPLLATAIAWHDVARCDSMGLLLRLPGPARRIAGRVPLAHNLSIAHVTLGDARRSIAIAERQLRRFGLSAVEIAEVSSIIAATDSRFMVAGPPREPAPGGVILSDADALDVLSLGRWEVLVNNSLRADPVVARHFDQVAWLAFHYAVPKLQQILVSPLARQLYTFWSSASLEHLRRYYPDDLPHYHAALVAAERRATR